MRSIQLILPLFSLLFLTVACDPEMPPIDPNPDVYGPGLYIVNEGPFVSGTGTITFQEITTDSVSQTIYQTANDGAVLGNVAQSLTFHSERGYVVVNNANLIRVVDHLTFREEGTITDLSLPRYLTPFDAFTAYVSQWGALGTNGSVAIVDLQTLTITDTLATGSGPEEVLYANGKIYVVNSGGFGRDSTLVVINPGTRTIEEVIPVGQNPVSVVSDGAGDIWTLGAGYWANFNDPDDPANIPGKLCRVGENGIPECIDVPLSAGNLIIGFNGIDLYYTAEGKIWRYPTVGAPTSPDVFFEGNFYALYWDDFNQELLAADAGDFASPGKVIRINSSGEQVGVIPAGIVPTYMIRK